LACVEKRRERRTVDQQHRQRVESRLFALTANGSLSRGEYDGNVDVYVVAASGGEPKRITYHPGGDGVVG
jgi:tricorn protease-like protein